MAELESSLKECLNLPSSSTGGRVVPGGGGLGEGLSISPVKPKISLRTFLHMPDDEYAAALEEAINRSSNSWLTYTI